MIKDDVNYSLIYFNINDVLLFFLKQISLEILAMVSVVVIMDLVIHVREMIDKEDHHVNDTIITIMMMITDQIVEWIDQDILLDTLTHSKIIENKRISTTIFYLF